MTRRAHHCDRCGRVFTSEYLFCADCRLVEGVESWDEWALLTAK